jgi:hypothetical protein
MPPGTVTVTDAEGAVTAAGTREANEAIEREEKSRSRHRRY